MNINVFYASISGSIELTVRMGRSRIGAPNVKHTIGTKEG
jgi:hypothetical protein